jgi:AraC-like DNA-binding protein
MRSRHVKPVRKDRPTVRPRSIDRVGEWLRVRQTTVVRGSEDAIDVLGPSWMLALVDVRRGSIAYARCGSEVAVPWNRFAVFAPPGSILQARLSRCRIDTEALASDGAVPWASRSAEAWPVAATVRLPETLDDLRRLFAERTDTLMIGRDDVRSGIAWKAKRRLDSRFASRMTLESLSRELGTSPAAMSRAFRRAYGMPPREYRHRLRALAAVHRLTSGRPVVDSLAEAGFGDVSQTYRAFRALLCATPGSYARSRIAKT